MNTNPASDSQNFIANEIPNPANNYISVQSTKKITQINIYNMLGVLVLSQTNPNLISVINLQSGVYYAEAIFSDNSIKMLEFIKR